MTTTFELTGTGDKGVLLLAHWDELGRRTRRGESPGFVATSLVALRAVEAWLGHDDDEMLARVRADVASGVAEGTVPEPLLAVTDALTASSREDVSALAAALFEYGRALEDSRHHGLALEVYAALLAATGQADCEIVARAFVRLGRCYLALQNLDRATGMFSEACNVAIRCEETAVELLALLGHARLHVLRGNLQEADNLCIGIQRRAEALGDDDIRSRVLHDRAIIAQFAGRHAEVFGLVYEAVRLCRDERERRVILHDCGLSIVESGRYRSAVALFSGLAQRAPERLNRDSSLINLLYVHSRFGNRAEFDRAVRRVGRRTFAPIHTVQFYIEYGAGLARLGESGEARVQLQKGVALAREYGLLYLLSYAERLLSGELEDRPILQPTDDDTDDGMDAVIEVLLALSDR